MSGEHSSPLPWLRGPELPTKAPGQPLPTLGATGGSGGVGGERGAQLDPPPGSGPQPQHQGVWEPPSSSPRRRPRNKWPPVFANIVERGWEGLGPPQRVPLCRADPRGLISIPPGRSPPRLLSARPPGPRSALRCRPRQQTKAVPEPQLCPVPGSHGHSHTTGRLPACSLLVPPKPTAGPRGLPCSVSVRLLHPRPHTHPLFPSPLAHPGSSSVHPLSPCTHQGSPVPPSSLPVRPLVG